MIWEASDPYLYMRTTADGRVICGGEDEEFSDLTSTRRADPEEGRARLRRKLEKLFPQIDATPEFAWAGAFGTTNTGLPRSAQIRGKKNCWAILGFGGNGITYSRIAADIIAAALAGQGRPRRRPLYAFR